MTTNSENTLAPRWGVALIVGSALFSAPAHAYLDPGTGSVILQGLLAGIAVAAGVLRMYWHRFKSLFSRPKTQAVAAADEDAETRDSEASSL